MRFCAVVPCYNAAESILRCLDSLLAQQLDDGTSLEVIVADDGSTDGTAGLVERTYGGRVRTVSLGRNQGRSSARNAGAAATDAEVLLFIDADCVAADTGLVLAHEAAIEAGASLSFGDVRTPGMGFWAKLQEDAAATRRRRAKQGDAWWFTTANVALRREAFDAVGGFDPVFNRHGFEDRDLFIRLLGHGARAAFTGNAVVFHEGDVSLARTCSSFLAAGRHSSHEFFRRHPEAYRRLAFGKLDCRLRPWLRHVDRATWPVARWMARMPAKVLESRWLPFRLRLVVARAAYSLHYLHGTAYPASPEATSAAG